MYVYIQCLMSWNKHFTNLAMNYLFVWHFTFQDAGLGREGRLMHGWYRIVSPPLYFVPTLMIKCGTTRFTLTIWVRNASDVDAGTCVPKFQFQCYGTNMWHNARNPIWIPLEITLVRQREVKTEFASAVHFARFRNALFDLSCFCLSLRWCMLFSPCVGCERAAKNTCTRCMTIYRMCLHIYIYMYYVCVDAL